MGIADVSGLCKAYPSFLLDDVSFSLEPGRITGFIGRNGAGKTTTIKAMLNLIHPDKGDIRYFGMPLWGNETEIKNRIGYSAGNVNRYPRKKIRELTDVTKRFYKYWDDGACRRYLGMLGLDEEKTPLQLSQGMQVKYDLMIALSHHAEVLILDEPTSGLDPFSRSELLDVFGELKDSGIAVFFSTHIISDLEKCADDIVYISGGRIAAADTRSGFTGRYSMPGETLEDTILRLERGEKNV